MYKNVNLLQTRSLLQQRQDTDDDGLPTQTNQYPS